jgi:ABC-2 type transport system permease protein
MRPLWAIAKREVTSFFLSPLAYVVLTAWLLYQGASFWIMATWSAMSAGTGGSHDSPLQHFYGGTTLFYIPLLVFVPLLTMRLLAEEHRQGTIEPLLTAPVNEVHLVLGKYLAAMIFWLALWAPTFIYVIITAQYGSVDWGVIGATFLGLFTVGAYYMSIGLVTSALAKNQMSAAVLAFSVLSALFVSGLMQFLSQDDASRGIWEFLSVWQHMSSFSTGLVDSRYLVFEVSVAALGVLLAIRVVETRRYES